MPLSPSNNIEKEVLYNRNAAFEQKALLLFSFQYDNNPIYRSFCKALNIKKEDVLHIEQIPFLPISFFKTHEVVSSEFAPALFFESSGTTGSQHSRHLIKDVSIYERSFNAGFEEFYGEPKQYCILALLPSYLQRGHSSLVYMVKELIEQSDHPQSGFYLNEYEKLQQTILQNEAAAQPTLLIGVTYALLDFAEQYPMPLKYTTVMETGGMKGRREELTRTEVHALLTRQLGITQVHSEYGMTELLSQAYSVSNGIFKPSATMKILLRAEDDPFDICAAPATKKHYQTGAINIIDLANIYSCAFIATDDMGKLYPDGSFEVLGRLDNSDIRGCSLMTL